MPRFLHTADWQIGRQYARFSEDDAPLLFDVRFIAIERIAELAQREQVDAVLVAGDVFDAQTVSNRTIHRTFQAMVGFAGPWVLIPGNHDAALAESVWSRASRLKAIPDNVQVLLAPEVRLFAEVGFAVLPAPLTQRQTHSDLTHWFDQAETPADLVRIGLAHGSVEGQLAGDIDSTNPIAEKRAESARLDYLALGDWHGTKRIDARTWYSGTPEQERFKDNGAGQVLLVDIEKPGASPQVTPHSIGEYRWIKQEHTLSVETDLHSFMATLGDLPPMSVIDLTLKGRLSLEGHHALRQALSAAEARHRSLQYDLTELRLEPTDEDIAALQADGYIGEVIDQLRQQQAQSLPEEAETAQQALGILASLLRDRQQEGVQS